MLGMPVENQAVARSPQGIAIAVAEPPAKSILRHLCGSGTSSSTPFRRTRLPCLPRRRDRTIVRAVPGLMGPRASNASTRWIASGNASLSTAAIQSVGMTSNPRTNDDSGCLRIRVAALRGKEDVDLASNIDIVRSARKAGINHRSTGRREWAGAIRHNRHVRDRGRSRCRIVKAEDPHGQTEFGRQFLDRAGTPTGQYRLKLTSPRLRGHKTPRIAVGAVNHPLCAAGHTRLTVLS